MPPPGGRLTGDSDIGLFDLERALEANCPADSEDDDARTGGLDGGAQAAGAAVVEVCDLNDAATPATNRLGTGTFGTGKRRNRRGLGTYSHADGSEHEGCYDEKHGWVYRAIHSIRAL